MKLHHNSQEFNELIDLTSQRIHIPASAVRKDYFITMILEHLAKSQYVDCVYSKAVHLKASVIPIPLRGFLKISI